MNRWGSKPSRRATIIAAGAVSALALTAVPITASAAPGGNPCANRNNNTIAKIMECVTAEGVYEHLQAFQRIAEENGGNRASVTPGYDASVDYVVDVLTKAGWNVWEDTFDFEQQNLPLLEVDGTEYLSGYFLGSAVGQVTGHITPVDLSLAAPANSTSGCEPGDFVGFPAGDVALIQRGFCNFSIKVENAAIAGASAVIIFNQGNGGADRMDPFLGDLQPYQSPIPVVSASFQAGSLFASGTHTATIEHYAPEVHPQSNVIAELPGRNANNVVMAGAHLDSVFEGPGINDNGSGSAALLEVAQNLSKLKPENTIRFAWWAAEEDGLVGSQSYVDRLSPEELDRIALYLNFDMVGSPNYIFMIYDGDESGFPAPVVVPPGSVEIEDLFERYFTSIGEPYDDAEFSGRSDYEAFIFAGVPSGGLFTGAEDAKTAEQAAIWGGTAGAWLDPCYHQACDTLNNVSMKALEVNSDAIAMSVLAYSYSTELINGVKGKSIPGGLNLPDPAGPQGTTPASGGLAHDHAPVG